VHGVDDAAQLPCSAATHIARARCTAVYKRSEQDGRLRTKRCGPARTLPWGGLATWSTSQAATWHSSCASVRSSRSALSSTLQLSSIRAVYLSNLSYRQVHSGKLSCG